MFRRLSVFLFALAGALALPAGAGTTIDLSAEASLPAANDLARAVVYAEASGADPAELARRVNQDLAEALSTIKRESGVAVKSGQQSTWPIYGNNGRRIESWRLRAELHLESAEVSRLSELLGRLQQQRLALASVSQAPAPATRRAVEEAAMREALQAFERRAGLLAGALGKTYRIKQLTISQAGVVVPPPMPRGGRALLAAEALAAPIEAGESAVTVSLSGQIELAD